MTGKIKAFLQKIGIGSHPVPRRVREQRRWSLKRASAPAGQFELLEDRTLLSTVSDLQADNAMVGAIGEVVITQSRIVSESNGSSTAVVDLQLAVADPALQYSFSVVLAVVATPPGIGQTRLVATSQISFVRGVASRHLEIPLPTGGLITGSGEVISAVVTSVSGTIVSLSGERADVVRSSHRKGHPCRFT